MARAMKTGLRFPSGKLRPEPADANMKWQRQWRLAELEIISKTWGSTVARLHRFGYITAAELEAADRWGEMVGRYDRIKGLPARSVRSPQYEDGYCRTTGNFSSLRAIDFDHIKMVENCRKAVIRMSSFPALMVLNDVVLGNVTTGTEQRLKLMRSALRALIRYWHANK